MNLAMDSFVVFLHLFPTLISSKNCPPEDDPSCRVRFEGGINVERYYKWLPETEPPLNMAIPDELNYFCQNDEATFCRFPQDLTSQSYYSTENNVYFPIFNPYPRIGSYAVSTENVSLGSDYNDDSFQCGKIREDYVVTLENRKKAPPTILVGDTFGYYDTPVNNKGYCVPYNCPLLIKIHSPEFQSTDLNGYYVLNYPPTFQKFLVAKGNNLIPTYKHLNRNLYLIPKFTKLDDNRLGKYIISETPWMPQKKCLASSQAKSDLEIMVQHETDITLETMGQRYCFTQGKVVSMTEHYLNLIGTSEAEQCQKQDQKITQFTIEQLSKQCGLTYRASENTLFNSGVQPFVVDVVIKGVHCIGTLISPMHILTLATCFMLKEDIFDIEKNVMRRCGLKKGWRDCPRWFRPNTDPKGGNFPPIQVKTFESIRGTIADLPVAWFEIHPLFDGQEFDVAILGLKSYIQRNIFLHPICLPKWSTIDLEGKATIDRLYRSTQWEKYQMLYSLKALQKDVRFSNVWTDVNGPAKFQKCKSDPTDITTDWKEHCHLNPIDDKALPRQLNDHKLSQYQTFYQDTISDKPYLEGGVNLTKTICESFYSFAADEQGKSYLLDRSRRIRNLQDNNFECFAEVTLEFLVSNINAIKCYERRPSCLKKRGWCHAGQDFGFCSDINAVPDIPDAIYPLLEVQTFILPKEECKNAKLVNSASRICTGHMTRAPSEYIFQVNREQLKNSNGEEFTGVVFDAVEYIGGIQRPLAKGVDSQGRLRTITSALEGICHGSGVLSDPDKGAPTYFRYPVDKSGTGQGTHPGSSYAILYSLQKVGGRFCDFKAYTDTEVLVATDDIMEWIEAIVVEIEGTQRTLFDIEYSKIEMNLDSMVVTTTSRTTNLARTTTRFEDVWANRGPFKNTLKETIERYPYFKAKMDRKLRSKIVTKPPLMFFENYDLFDSVESDASSQQPKNYVILHISFIIQMLTMNF